MKRNFFDLRPQPLLPICLFVLVITSCNNASNEQASDSDSAKKDTIKHDTAIVDKDTAVLTVWMLKERTPDTLNVIFNESERLYYIVRSLENFTEKNNFLSKAAGNIYPLKITFDVESGQIRSVDTLIKAEADSFLIRYKKLRKPISLVPSATPAVDMTKANEIFKYCADQKCPTPANVTPCITFQYVIDGCYARAHMMRDIVETKYKISVRKVFSFATPGTNSLAVEATKWGGCCVEWTYHVAPVIEVKVGTVETDYVIDPGMFDKVVKVSEWVDAQKNKCAHSGVVQSSSIQPGEYYTPIRGGERYTTDPTLSDTKATLIAYKERKTCTR